jgi:hypothetical protein
LALVGYGGDRSLLTLSAKLTADSIVREIADFSRHSWLFRIPVFLLGS